MTFQISRISGKGLLVLFYVQSYSKIIVKSEMFCLFQNLSEETRNIDIDLSANTVFYTRAHVDTVKQGQVKVEVKPKDSK